MPDNTDLIEACLQRIGAAPGAKAILAWLVQVSPSRITNWLSGKDAILEKHRAVLETIASEDEITIQLRPLSRVVVPREAERLLDVKKGVQKESSRGRVA